MKPEAIYVSDSWWIQALPWGMLAFLIWITIKVISTSGTSSFLILLILGALILWSGANIVRSPRKFEINSSAIAKVGWFWRHKMSWNEIVYIEYWHSRRGFTGIIFFNKEDKALLLNGPSDWWDTDYRQVLELIESQVMQRGIRTDSKQPSMTVL
jgi:hypothetical protein